jgi:hypothetical protein
MKKETDFQNSMVHSVLSDFSLQDNKMVHQHV